MGISEINLSLPFLFMAVFFDIEHLPKFNNAVITIGTFDGVHLGHRAILQEVVNHAKALNGDSIVITFEPHPRKLLMPELPLKLINSLHQRLILINQAGIKHVVVVPFTQLFSHLSALEYVENFLIHYFKPKSIVIGYDHHFGHDRKGNIGLLRLLSSKFKYELIEISARLIKEASVSSTKIRAAISEGNIEEAVSMLGHYFTLKGIVVEGKKLGRSIGFPTANIKYESDEQILPPNGVYAIKVKWNSRIYKGMLNIGYNPTVSVNKDIKIEANLFNFDQDIYGETIEISFVKKIRDEIKFSSIEELIEQLRNDKTVVESVLKNANEYY